MAATDADSSFPYDSGPGASVLESQWRSMARWWLTSGPVRGELSSFGIAAPGGRALNIGAGRCWIEGAFGEFSGVTTVNFGTNTSGNTRIDLVVIRNDFVANKVQMDVLVGTPSGSPVAPTPTQNSAKWEIGLFQVTCANNFSSLVVGTNTTDVRPWAQGRPPGGSAAGSAVIACASTRQTNLSLTASTWTRVDFVDGEDYDTAAIHDVSTNPSRFLVLGGMGGLWGFSILASFAGPTPAVVSDKGVQIWKNGSALRTGPIFPATTANAINTNVGWYYEDVFTAGDYIEWYVSQDSASGTLSFARATARYHGPVI